MKWSYACPGCNGVLNPQETIILVALHKDKRLLVGFHPEPGNYTIYTPPGVSVEPGSRWDFYCPLCQTNLSTKENPDLCVIHMLTGARPYRVLFSRVAGRRATFVMGERGIHEQHGDDATHYFRNLLQTKWF